MKAWAEKYPNEFKQYFTGLWDLMGELEENNVVVRSRAPGCWRIDINF
jgi:hypothetical protein